MTIIKGLLKGERLTFAGLPTASDIPAMRIVHQHSPSPLNPPSAMKAIPFTFDELEAHLSSDETPGIACSFPTSTAGHRPSLFCR